MDDQLKVLEQGPLFLANVLGLRWLRPGSLRGLRGLGRRFGPGFQGWPVRSRFWGRRGRGTALWRSTETRVLPPDIRPAIRYLLLEQAKRTEMVGLYYQERGAAPSAQETDFRPHTCSFATCMQEQPPRSREPLVGPERAAPPAVLDALSLW